MATIIGIDPGLKGGVCLISDAGAFYCYEMPVNKDGIDARALRQIIAQHNNCIAYVEHAQAMPKQGVVGVFTYGVGFGKILATLEICGIETKLVRPAVWKKAMGLPKEKEAAVAMAERLNPLGVFRTERGRLLDGKAEALLIAVYGATGALGARKGGKA